LFTIKSMYRRLIKPILFFFDPEKVHNFIFFIIKWSFKIPGLKYTIRKIFSYENPKLERTLWGITFKNPIGLAAGFDKDAKLYNELSYFGFGFIEIGTLTPEGQGGNVKKRLFRLTDDSALINRMGFNNQGVESAIERLKKNKNVIIGGNIGKNKKTSNLLAFEDYEKCFISLFPYVDYFSVNVSSPNTPNLRELQDKKPLKKILMSLTELNNKQINKKPILLKISPDLNKQQLLDIIKIIETVGLDGVIATNTTIDRSQIKSNTSFINEPGGLSGKPLSEKSNDVIRFISKESNNRFPIIGVGGIHSPEDAIDKINAGASLVQLYTGFIYEGPGLIKKINKKLVESIN